MSKLVVNKSFSHICDLRSAHHLFHTCMILPFRSCWWRPLQWLPPLAYRTWNPSPTTASDCAVFTHNTWGPPQLFTMESATTWYKLASCSPNLKNSYTGLISNATLLSEVIEKEFYVNSTSICAIRSHWKPLDLLSEHTTSDIFITTKFFFHLRNTSRLHHLSMLLACLTYKEYLNGSFHEIFDSFFFFWQKKKTKHLCRGPHNAEKHCIRLNTITKNRHITIISLLF